MPEKPDQTAISEWLEHPAAGLLRHALGERINWLAGERASVFFAGEPARTQEAIIEIEARLTELRSVQSWLESVGQFRSEVSHAEHERILSGGIPGTGQTGPY